MRRRFVRNMCLALVVTVSTGLQMQAQTGQSQPQSSGQQAQQEDPLEQWRKCTVSFGVVEKDQFGQQFYKATGSGVLFVLSPTAGYVVTAKHVFYEPDKNYHPSEIRLRFAFQEGESVYQQLGVAVSLRDGSGKDLWVALDENTDIAALRINPSIADQPAVSPTWLGGSDDLYQGESIFVLGFPGIVGNKYLIRPIVRGGIVAWIDPKSPYEHLFLVDSNIYPGNSGGPVIRGASFYNPKGSAFGSKATMLGIVIEAPGQAGDTFVNVPGFREPLKIHQEIPIGGTGVVEPASKVKALLAKLPLT